MAEDNGTPHVDPARIAAIEKALGIGDVDAENRSMAALKADAEERAVADMQAVVEGVPMPRWVEFLGRKYRLGEKIGLMPLLKFAHAASSGLGADDLEGMAAMYAMIRDCVHEGDWPKFEKAAIDGHADGDDLMKVVEQAMEQITARPTGQPSASSPPERTASPNSKEPSSLPGRVPEAFRKAAEAGDLIDINSLAQ